MCNFISRRQARPDSIRSRYGSRSCRGSRSAARPSQASNSSSSTSMPTSKPTTTKLSPSSGPRKRSVNADLKAAVHAVVGIDVLQLRRDDARRRRCFSSSWLTPLFMCTMLYQPTRITRRSSARSRNCLIVSDAPTARHGSTFRRAVRMPKRFGAHAVRSI